MKALLIGLSVCSALALAFAQAPAAKQETPAAPQAKEAPKDDIDLGEIIEVALQAAEGGISEADEAIRHVEGSLKDLSPKDREELHRALAQAGKEVGQSSTKVRAEVAKAMQEGRARPSKMTYVTARRPRSTSHLPSTSRKKAEWCWRWVPWPRWTNS